jgi:ubiquinone/menaquinone biosynthesis C-methylase UbiE
LPDNSIDLVLLYDTFHSLSDPNKVLEELNRILKTGGILSFSDHHMKENEILTAIISGGFFKFFEDGKEIYNFIKEDQ